MTQSHLSGVLARLDHLLADLSTAAARAGDAIDGVAPVHASGAINLVHYATLRGQDLRQLQSDLTDLGVTSLATTEANVQAKIEAARTVVSALNGDPGPWDLEAITNALDAGDRTLTANTTALFGPARPDRPVRIMVTLPSDAGTPGGPVGAFVDAGMDVARVNCAHDTPAVWAAMIDQVRAAARAAGRDIAVSMDLPGPKLRTGPIAPGPRVGRARVTRTATGHLLAPATIWLTPADNPADVPADVPTDDPAGDPGDVRADGASAPPDLLGARPALPLRVDPAWLAARRTQDRVTLTDTRGRRRRFTVSAIHPGGVLAEGSRSAFIPDGCTLHSAGTTTTATGVTPLAQRLLLRPGDLLILTADLTPVVPPLPGQVARIGCTLPEALTAAAPGHQVLLDDGAIAATVRAVAPGEVTVQVTRTKPGGQHLGAEKGINLPDTLLDVPALTPDDDAYLPFIAAHADVVALSFIRTAADVDHALGRLRAAGAEHLGLILKIETRQGFDDLPNILLAAMRHPRIGVMVARGDLAAEVGYPRLSEIPRQILGLCEAAHIPAIWATQVLETLAQTGQPSRAEITDAAVAQRADAVMLNKGPYMTQAITTLDDILTRMSHNQHKSRPLLRHIHAWD